MTASVLLEIVYRFLNFHLYKPPFSQSSDEKMTCAFNGRKGSQPVSNSHHLRSSNPMKHSKLYRLKNAVCREVSSHQDYNGKLLFSGR